MSKKGNKSKGKEILNDNLLKNVNGGYKLVHITGKPWPYSSAGYKKLIKDDGTELDESFWSREEAKEYMEDNNYEGFEKGLEEEIYR